MIKQRMEYDRVVYEIGSECFMTQHGIVVEGNFRIGDKVLLVFDYKSRRYLPSFKREKPPPHEEEDFIVKPSEGCSCELHLLNVPTIVQPMQYAGIIGLGTVCPDDPWQIWTNKVVPLEVEGTDFIKTYYTIANTCTNPQQWTACPTAQLIQDSCGPGCGGKFCHPFIYTKSGVPYRQTVPPDLTNHCIYTLIGCQAEIIAFGEDEGGKFFIWKAYTEWTVCGPKYCSGVRITFSRTGLGYLNLDSLIYGSRGQLACHDQHIVEVDCCKKSIDKRNVELWWEGAACDGGFMFYGDATICKVPATTTLTGLYALWFLHNGLFYVIPDVKGGCIPFSWTATGPGTITPEGEYAFLAAWAPSPDFASRCDDVTITVRDRCGKEASVKASCCATATAVSISYTSLVMGCNQSQTLGAVGGCGPYTWSSSGGGTLVVDDPQGSNATFTSPLTNPGCGSNGHVTVTDCCGKTGSLQIAINCYIGSDSALEQADLIKCSCYKIRDPNCAGMEYNSNYDVHIRRWDCHSISLLDCLWGTACGTELFPPCTNSCPCDSSDEPGCWNDMDCSVSNPECGTGGASPCNVLMDRRSVAMKDAGCCPINPITGLPYS